MSYPQTTVPTIMGVVSPESVSLRGLGTLEKFFLTSGVFALVLVETEPRGGRQVIYH